MELNATFLLQLAMFLLLLSWLSEFLFQPLFKLFEERERRIEGAAKEAEALKAGADDAAARIDAEVSKATADARTVLTELRQQGMDAEAAALEAAREKSRDRLDDARSELFAATQTAQGALKGDADKLAGDIVQKILGRAA